jgi:tripartite-type tricarboxylate transporter receptor subunit TctC
MKLPRRREFLHLAAGAAVLPLVSRIASAQSYPTRPVRILVGFAAGSTSDIIARLIGQWLSQRLGQQFIVENRPGAGSNIATEAVVKASPDGYTLLFITPSNAINATLYEKLNFNFLRDITLVASLYQVAQVMEVTPSLPATTVPDFIAYAKSSPGKINVASGGSGSVTHVSGELFKMMTGADLVHVPYRGAGPALTDLIGGQVQVMFDAIPSSIEHIRAGRLRPLAVTTARRSALMPELPTVSDFLPGYEASSWYGLGAPMNTPAEIVQKVNQEVNAGLSDLRLKARLADLGGTVISGSPLDFRKFVADETERWGKVVKFSGAKPD